MAKKKIKDAPARAKKQDVDADDILAGLQEMLGFEYLPHATLHGSRAEELWKLLREFARQVCEGECPKCVAFEKVRERQKNCQECKQPNHQNFIVTDAVWAATGLTMDGGTLHLACLERRLGRQLTAEDFTNDRPNASLRFGHAMAERSGKAGESALSIIDHRIKKAFGAPAMHGNPRQYETWVCAQLDIWEAIRRGEALANEPRLWFDLWREECATAGRNQTQSLSTLLRQGAVVPLTEATSFELKRTTEEVTRGLQNVWRALHVRLNVPVPA